MFGPLGSEAIEFCKQRVTGHSDGTSQGQISKSSVEGEGLPHKTLTKLEVMRQTRLALDLK